MKITLEQAITSLCPTSSFVINDGNFDNIEWLSDVPKPSKQEVDAEVIRLQDEYDAKEYQRKRVAEYPSYADQFDTIFHEGIDAWKAQIQAVKDKYPKGK
jgi:hypothetical protein